MTILNDIAKCRYIATKLNTELEMICLNRSDVVQLSDELYAVAALMFSAKLMHSMMTKGIINEPLKVFGMNITSRRRV